MSLIATTLSLFICRGLAEIRVDEKPEDFRVFHQDKSQILDVQEPEVQVTGFIAGGHKVEFKGRRILRV